MIALLVAAQTVSAQTVTSAFLPYNHWTHQVLRRLDGAGLLPPGSDVARRSIPSEEAAQLLSYAAAKDSNGIAAGYLRKFREEFRSPRDGGIAIADASISASYIVEENQVLAGVGYDSVWTGVIPVDDARKARAFARTGFTSPHVAGSFSADDESVRELQLVLSSGAVGVWAGRRAIGYSAGHAGGLVLDVAKLDGGGLFLTRPLKLGFLGQTRLEVQLSQIDNVLNFRGSEHDIEPWLLSGRLSIEPHPVFRFGLNRGMMFGGNGNYPITFSRLLNNVLGFSNSRDREENAFANQVGSADGRLRIPGLSFPLVIYAEWAVDDLAGGWWDQPGILVGAEASALPGNDVVFGLERTEFKRHSDNGLWYQNSWFRGGWSDGGTPLGHPLGGYGKEWRLYAGGGAPARGVIGEVAAYHRNRKGANLFSPERKGRSLGVAGNVDARLSKGMRFFAAGELENGDNWTATRAHAGVRLGF